MAPPLYVHRAFDSLADLFAHVKEHYWQRTPVVFRGHGLGPVLGDQATMLDGLRGLRRHTTPPRIYRDGTRLALGDADWCTDQDPSLEAYVDRLRAAHGGEELLVLPDEFERSAASVWFHACRFMAALYDVVGFPVGPASINAFAGRYRRTPFGFHKDVTDSFMSALVGEKRYRVWTYDAIAARMELFPGARHQNVRWEKLDYARFDDCVAIIDTQPGDLVYWPWDCFHIGEPSDGQFTASIAIGIEPFAQPFKDLKQTLQVAATAPYATRVDAFAPGAQPDPTPGWVETIRRAAEDREVLETMREELVLRRSRFGFREPLPRTVGRRTFADADTLIPPMAGLIVWTELRGRLFVALNGYGFAADSDPALLALLGELNRGEPLGVGDLRARYDAFTTEELDELLGVLFQMRGFEHATAAGLQPRRAVAAGLDGLLERARLFPLQLVDDGASVLMGVVRDEQHADLDGDAIKAVRIPVYKLLGLAAERHAEAVRQRFVLTQGYSGSTLLGRCIDAMPGCLTIYEPRVLTDWALLHGSADADRRRAWREVLAALTPYLFRAEDPETRVVVKVGPHVLDAAEELLAAPGEPRAVHLYARLPAYLANTLKCERRRDDLRTSARAAGRAAVAAQIGAPRVDITGERDARAIAYLWLTDLGLYRWLRARPVGRQLRSLDFDRFLREPARALRAVADHLELGLPPGAEDELAAGPVLRRHAKAATTAAAPYDLDQRAIALAAEWCTRGDEIGDALAWASAHWGGALPDSLADDLLDPRRAG